MHLNLKGYCLLLVFLGGQVSKTIQSPMDIVHGISPRVMQKCIVEKLSLDCLYIYLNEFLKPGLEHFSPKNSDDVTTSCSALSLAKEKGDTSLVVVPLCTTCLFYYMLFLYPYNSKLFKEYIYVCIFFSKGGKSWLLWEAIQVKNSSSGLVHWDDPKR